VSTASSQPYGPETAAVRGFLVRLAGLGTTDRAAVVARYETLAATRAYQAADARLGEVIARSGREQARDALTGPLLQLTKRPVADTDTPAAVGEEIALEPIAEPALAALLALMVRDLLDDATMRLLTEAFSETLPPR
jgi:hypothetical protein